MKKKKGSKIKRRRRNQFVLGMLMVFGAAAIAIGGWYIYINIGDRQEKNSLYSQLAQTAVLFDNVQSSVEETTATNPPTAVDFQMLKEINPSTVAWIWSANGKISYPAVQGNDNDYYLDHLIDGTKDENGTLFMDYRNANEFSDRNTFIYGNQTNSDEMLSSIKEYAKEGYYRQHPTLLMITEHGSYTLEVFSGYSATTKIDPYQLTYSDEEAFLNYISVVKQRSDFVSDISPSENDRIVTLSTGKASAEEGYVLHCKVVERHEE